jgi:hypothetical protein
MERSSASKQLELLERLKRLEQAPLVERLEPLEQASLNCVQSDGGPRSAGQNGRFFPTIPDDSTGFEDPKVASGLHEAKHLSQDLSPIDQLNPPVGLSL